MKNAQYAFWEYDKFPYILGGEITRFVWDNDGDKVEVIQLGKGYWIKPDKIVDLAKGLKIQVKLNKLKELRQDMMQVIESQMKLKLNEIMKEFN